MGVVCVIVCDGPRRNKAATQKKVEDSFQLHFHRFLCVTDDILEGNQQGLVVLLEFDSMDEARRFYFSDGYTAAKLVREQASEADLILVEGV